MTKEHALVIGGTGMLKGVCLWLVEKGYTVSVIARNEDRHHQLKEASSCPESINSLVVDYTNEEELEGKVRNATEVYGPITLIISWTPYLESLELINHVVEEKSRSWKLFQVKGSRRYFEERTLKVPKGCSHRSIYLGFIREGERSRWLFHGEIVEGVIKSVKEDKESIVGVLHPYEQRPGNV